MAQSGTRKNLGRSRHALTHRRLRLRGKNRINIADYRCANDRHYRRPSRTQWEIGHDQNGWRTAQVYTQRVPTYLLDTPLRVPVLGPPPANIVAMIRAEVPVYLQAGFVIWRLR
jgi:hypothetical protein